MLHTHLNEVRWLLRDIKWLPFHLRHDTGGIYVWAVLNRWNVPPEWMVKWNDLSQHWWEIGREGGREGRRANTYSGIIKKRGGGGGGGDQLQPPISQSAQANPCS